MKKLLILLLFVSFLSTACITQKVVTPPDKPIQLATSDMKCVLADERTDWFFFWGLSPLGESNTAEMLSNVNHPVKIEYVTTFSDGFIGIFSALISFVPKTVRVYECSK